MKTLCGILTFISLALLGSTSVQCQIMSVSVPALHVAENERVVGFEVHVRSGRIALLPNVPIGWNIVVDNDPSWNTTIKGSIEAGAAAMDPGFLRDFMVIEIAKDVSSNAPFELQGEVIVTSDFVKERRIKLSMKDFSTKGAGRAKSATTGH